VGIAEVRLQIAEVEAFRVRSAAGAEILSERSESKDRTRAMALQVRLRSLSNLSAG